MNRCARVLAGVAVLMAARAAGAQTVVEADLPSEHWSAGVDAGWAGKYDDSGLWRSGYAVGVSGYYSPATTLLLGGRFGVSHWDYVPDGVVRDLLPPDGELLGAKSSGQTEIVEFGALVRAERPETLGKLSVFAQTTAMLGYVKHFALTEILYVDAARGDEAAKYELNESDWRLCVLVVAGLGHKLTEQSIIEVFPWYRFVFEGGDVVMIPGISLGWRVRV